MDEAPTARPGSGPELAHSAAPALMVDEIKARQLGPAARALLAVTALLAALLAINQLLNLQLFAGVVFIENRYLYLLGAVLFPPVFVALPASARQRRPTPWYDWVLAALSCALLIWFAWQADRILSEGWNTARPGSQNCSPRCSGG